jgi:hypothetical protein
MPKISGKLDQALARHQATKHSFKRMAPGPKAMDYGIEPAPVGGIGARRSWSR